MENSRFGRFYQLHSNRLCHLATEANLCLHYSAHYIDDSRQHSRDIHHLRSNISFVYHIPDIISKISVYPKNCSKSNFNSMHTFRCYQGFKPETHIKGLILRLSQFLKIFSQSGGYSIFYLTIMYSEIDNWNILYIQQETRTLSVFVPHSTFIINYHFWLIWRNLNYLQIMYELSLMLGGEKVERMSTRMKQLLFATESLIGLEAEEPQVITLLLHTMAYIWVYLKLFLYNILYMMSLSLMICLVNNENKHIYLWVIIPCVGVLWFKCIWHWTAYQLLTIDVAITFTSMQFIWW